MSPVSSHQLFCPDTRTTHWTGCLLGFKWRRFDPHQRLGHGTGHFLALVSTLVIIWASFLRCNFSSSNLPNIQGRSCGILCVYASYSSNGMFIHARARTSLLHSSGRTDLVWRLRHVHSPRLLSPLNIRQISWQTRLEYLGCHDIAYIPRCAPWSLPTQREVRVCSRGDGTSMTPYQLVVSSSWKYWSAARRVDAHLLLQLYETSAESVVERVSVS